MRYSYGPDQGNYWKCNNLDMLSSKQVPTFTPQTSRQKKKPFLLTSPNPRSDWKEWEHRLFLPYPPFTPSLSLLRVVFLSLLFVFVFFRPNKNKNQIRDFLIDFTYNTPHQMDASSQSSCPPKMALNSVVFSPHARGNFQGLWAFWDFFGGFQPPSASPRNFSVVDLHTHKK